MGKLNNSLGTRMVTKRRFIGYMGSLNDISITYRYRESPLGDFPIIFSSIFYQYIKCHCDKVYKISMNFKLTIQERIITLKTYLEIFKMDLFLVRRRSI